MRSLAAHRVTTSTTIRFLFEMLPPRIHRNSGRQNVGKRSPAHRKWVAGHACCACGSTEGIEAAHVREGTDGGMGMKPSDRWVISLCKDCHARQHSVGEGNMGIDMNALAEAFFRASPHRSKLEAKQ